MKLIPVIPKYIYSSECHLFPQTHYLFSILNKHEFSSMFIDHALFRGLN